MDWQVYQFVSSSKVKIEVQVLNSQGLYLYSQVYVITVNNSHNANNMDEFDGIVSHSFTITSLCI